MPKLTRDNDPWENEDYTGPCFLVAGAPTGRFPKGYTNDPALGSLKEPQGLDGQEWQQHVKKRADQALVAERMQRERDAKLLSQEERIVKAQQEAAVKRRDVSRELWVLRQMQARGRPVQVIEKRVQGLERVVYLGRRAA